MALLDFYSDRTPYLQNPRSRFFPTTRQHLSQVLLPSLPSSAGTEVVLNELGKTGPRYEAEELQYAKGKAWIMLEEQLKAPLGTTHNGASRNTGEAIATVSANHILFAWQKIFAVAFLQQYKQAIQRIHDIELCPQQMRLLEQEADVGDIVFANVLAPVVETLNKLIHHSHQDKFRITVQHQPSRSFQALVWNKVTKQKEWKTLSIRADHALVLSHKANQVAEDTNSQSRPSRAYLAIIEEKVHLPSPLHLLLRELSTNLQRLGYVLGEEWAWEPKSHLDRSRPSSKDYRKRPNVRAHLDQLTLYMHHFSCRHFLLTDYEDGVSLYLNPAPKDQGKPELPKVEVSPCPSVGRSKKPYASIEENPINGRGGLRHAVLSLPRSSPLTNVKHAASLTVSRVNLAHPFPSIAETANASTSSTPNPRRKSTANHARPSTSAEQHIRGPEVRATKERCKVAGLEGYGSSHQITEMLGTS
ncbi:hypothetical protein JCM11641_001542 [Rhodosporidiobolus odoratus]